MRDMLAALSVTKPSRVRWQAAIDWADSDFIGTNLMPGRLAASAIAAASMKSFLLPLT